MAADPIDEANDLVIRENEQAVENALNRPDEPLPQTGRCHNCGEPVTELFCDADCRDDWERRKRMRR